MGVSSEMGINDGCCPVDHGRSCYVYEHRYALLQNISGYATNGRKSSGYEGFKMRLQFLGANRQVTGSRYPTRSRWVDVTYRLWALPGA